MGRRGGGIVSEQRKKCKNEEYRAVGFLQPCHIIENEAGDSKGLKGEEWKKKNGTGNPSVKEKEGGNSSPLLSCRPHCFRTHFISFSLLPTCSCAEPKVLPEHVAHLAAFFRDIAVAGCLVSDVLLDVEIGGCVDHHAALRAREGVGKWSNVTKLTMYVA